MKLEASSLKRNKVDNPIVRFTNNRRETAQINKIRNEKEEVIMDTTEIQMIIRDYNKQHGHHRNTNDYKRLQQATVHQ